MTNEFEKLKAPVGWFGGKGHMVQKISPYIAQGQVYVEPYGGGGSLMVRNRFANVEVYNDLNNDLVSLFRLLQNPDTYKQLEHRIQHTLYSRKEFADAIALLKSDEKNPILRAHAFFVAQNQGFSGEATSVGQWSRNFSESQGVASGVNSWLMRLTMIPDWHKRFLMWQIDNRDALEVISYWDSPDTSFYLDPPYIQDTRTISGKYKHETDNTHHTKLVELLLNLQGYAVLSGYDHPIYKPLEENGWKRIEFPMINQAVGRTRNTGVLGDGELMNMDIVQRTEILWINKKSQSKNVRKGYMNKDKGNLGLL